VSPDTADLAHTILAELRRQRAAVIREDDNPENALIVGHFDLVAVARAIEALPAGAPDRLILTTRDQRRRMATLAASQASEGISILLAFATDTESDETLTGTGDGEPAELLLDAAKIAIEVVLAEAEAAGEAPDQERNQVLGAISRYLEGWA
jgi:hypothetical protein